MWSQSSSRKQVSRVDLLRCFFSIFGTETLVFWEDELFFVKACRIVECPFFDDPDELAMIVLGKQIWTKNRDQHPCAFRQIPAVEAIWLAMELHSFDGQGILFQKSW